MSLILSVLLPFLQGFNGADLQNVCTEAGMSAILAERDYVTHEDFIKVMFVTIRPLQIIFFEAKRPLQIMICTF